MSVLFLKKPGVIQRPGPLEIDPYWLRRGLQMVVDNGVVVFNRESRAFATRVITGGPKTQVSKVGQAKGFGTTWGTGTTDRIDSGTRLYSPTSGMRSVVAQLFAKSTGGGSLGRVFQNTSGNGVANAGDEALFFVSAGGIALTRICSDASTGQYATSATPPLDKWVMYGASWRCDYPTNTVPLMFIDGAAVAVVAITAPAAAFTASTSMEVTFGNRPSDSARCWDGMLGLLLFFDGFLTAQEHATLAANPRQVFTSRQALWMPASGGGTTITCTVGNAAANGTTAAITRTIAATVGNAAADGTTANLIRVIATSTGNAAADGLTVVVTRTLATTVGNSVANGTTAAVTRIVATTTGNAVANGITASIVTDSSTTISCTVGNAVVDGLTAAVTRTVATTVGNAVADGTTAAVTRGIATTTGNAVADGSLGAVTRIIATATGDAAANGITASIVLDGSVTIACAVGNAVADGTLAAVTRTVATTPGNAVADGLTAGLIRTIATTTGNAVADGITATITIAGQTVIGCTPGNAAADGAMATVLRTITADPGNAVANGSIAELLRVIAAGPGNAVANGVTASILGATGISCIPGNAVAAGVTASIASGTRLTVDDLSVLTTQTTYTVTSGYEVVTVTTVASPLVVTNQTTDLCVQ